MLRTAKTYGLALAALAIASIGPAAAEDYPTRPITILTPFAAGSATDTAARLVGKFCRKVSASRS